MTSNPLVGYPSVVYQPSYPGYDIAKGFRKLVEALRSLGRGLKIIGQGLVTAFNLIRALQHLTVTVTRAGDVVLVHATGSRVEFLANGNITTFAVRNNHTKCGKWNLFNSPVMDAFEGDVPPGFEVVDGRLQRIAPHPGHTH